MLNKIFPAIDSHLNNDVTVLEPDKSSSQNVSFNESRIRQDSFNEENSSMEIFNTKDHKRVKIV